VLENDIYQMIGRNIYQLRKQRKMTQEFLAHQLQLSRTSISNIEKGKHRIQIHIIYKIAEILCVPVEKIVLNVT
jgi:DNA-binding XRE family transcriptional regulator